MEDVLAILPMYLALRFCGCGEFCENTDTTLPVYVMVDEIDGMVDNNR